MATPNPPPSTDIPTHSPPSTDTPIHSPSPAQTPPPPFQPQDQAHVPNSKTQQLHKEIDEATEVMRANAIKLAERGESLQALDSRSDDLQIQSKLFARQAERVRRRMWWQNIKWTTCIGLLAVIIVISIIVGAVKGTGH